MGETSPEIHINPPQTPAASVEKNMAAASVEKIMAAASVEINVAAALPDIDDVQSSNASMGSERDHKEGYSKTNLRIEQKPSRGEVWTWYLYEFCSYFIHAVLIPIVFPLILGQIKSQPPEPAQGWNKTAIGLPCWDKEMVLYRKVTYRSISIGNSSFSALEWTAISWGVGLLLANPILCILSPDLDQGQTQQHIAGVATFVGAFFCLPVGFFRTPWVFPLYVSAITIAITIVTASHTRHGGQMIRGFTGPTLSKTQFRARTTLSSWLSLLATAGGCLGSAVISAFTYYMLRIKDKFNGLWIVSIFSGLKWLVGVIHILTLRSGPTNNTSSPISKAYCLSIFSHCHAIGSLLASGLASFTTMCIFAAGVLHLIGELCLKPAFLLYLWLTYFIFPSVSLPLLQVFQICTKANTVKMQVLGFSLSMITSGIGFYYRNDNWRRQHALILAAVQSTSAGVLHAFGRVLLLDCSPAGKEGAFAIWLTWAKMVGTCAGFALASAVLDVSTSFGIAFSAAALGIVVLVFGNVSDVGGAIAAGHIGEEDGGKRLPANDRLESGIMGNADVGPVARAPPKFSLSTVAQLEE